VARSTKPKRRSVCLALQGGGALGAFTWGVLDALLAQGVAIEAVSGASAGAVNATLLAAGLATGGVEGARETLRAFWRDVSAAQGLPAATLDLLSRMALVPSRPSPLLVNPLGLNPLRDLLRKHVDFEAVRASRMELFVSATRVSDGAARVFRTGELTLEVLLASACLPQLHDAVEVDGDLYWDGGYSANPPLFELVGATRAPHLLLVELTTPIAALPSAMGHEIERRLHDLALSAALQREVSNLLTIQRICRDDAGARSRVARRLRDLHLHRISAPASTDDAHRLNALDTSWPTLTRLADLGRAGSRRWMGDDGHGPASC